MSTPNPTNVSPEMRLRTMRILWAAFLLSVGIYALVAYFAAPQTHEELDVRPDGSLGTATASAGFSVLLLVLFALGLSTVVASFLVKQAFAKRAVREQSTVVLQTGLILAVVLCEMAALFGLVGIFVEGNPFAYLLFVVAAAGMVLHFPRGEDVAAASGGGTGFGIGIN